MVCLHLFKSLNIKFEIAHLHFFVLSFVWIFYCCIANYLQFSGLTQQNSLTVYVAQESGSVRYFVRASSLAANLLFCTHLSLTYAPEDIKHGNLFWMMLHSQKCKPNFNPTSNFKNSWKDNSFHFFEQLLSSVFC